MTFRIIIFKKSFESHAIFAKTSRGYLKGGGGEYFHETQVNILYLLYFYDL
jgi:hypothetical protein